MTQIDLASRRAPPPPIPSRVYRAGEFWGNQAYIDKAVREALEHADQTHGAVGKALTAETYTIDHVRALLLRLGHAETEMFGASVVLNEIAGHR